MVAEPEDSAIRLKLHQKSKTTLQAGNVKTLSRRCRCMPLFKQITRVFLSHSRNMLGHYLNFAATVFFHSLYSFSIIH
jgi:hypothetical protein